MGEIVDEGFVLCGECKRWCGCRGGRGGRVGRVGCGVEDGEGDDENDDTSAGENGEKVSDAHMILLCVGKSTRPAPRIGGGPVKDGRYVMRIERFPAYHD